MWWCCVGFVEGLERFDGEANGRWEAREGGAERNAAECGGMEATRGDR